MATPEWYSGYVQTNGIRMHYYRTGGEKPPLVLSHGATDDGLSWTRLTRALESDYDVIMPDARGHGLSDAPEGGYSRVDHAADLAGLIQALELDRPALGGHSMGAATTLQLIATSPRIASCAILEDPPLRADESRPRVTTGEDPRAGMRRNVHAAKTLDRDAVIARKRAESPTWAEEEFGAWADAKARVSDQFMNALGRSPDTNWRSLLASIVIPVLLVTADPERGAIVTPEGAREAGSLLPTLRTIRLPGAGHNIRREQFDAFSSAVREFLATYARAGAPA